MVLKMRDPRIREHVYNMKVQYSLLGLCGTRLGRELLLMSTREALSPLHT